MAWEYFVAPLLEHNPGEILNTFGEDGWELVTVLAQPTPAGGVSLVAYLKRPKSWRRRVPRSVSQARREEHPGREVAPAAGRTSRPRIVGCDRTVGRLLLRSDGASDGRREGSLGDEVRQARLGRGRAGLPRRQPQDETEGDDTARTRIGPTYPGPSIGFPACSGSITWSSRCATSSAPPTGSGTSTASRSRREDGTPGGGRRT